MDIEKVLEEEFCIDVSGLGLRAYYYHPESISHYVSYPVSGLSAKTPPKIGRGRRSDIVNTVENSFYGDYTVLMPEGVVDFFRGYELSDFISDYFIGVFRESDEEVKKILLGHLSEWNLKESGEVYKFVGTNNPTKPFEYFSSI